MKNAIIDNMSYAHEHGTDRPEIVRLDLAVLSRDRWPMLCWFSMRAPRA